MKKLIDFLFNSPGNIEYATADPGFIIFLMILLLIILLLAAPWGK